MKALSKGFAKVGLEWFVIQTLSRSNLTIYKYLGQNGVLSILYKLFSKMSHVWNYLGIWPRFETQFLENWVSNVKLNFLDNRVIGKLNLEFFFFFGIVPLEYFQWTRVPQIFIFYFNFQFSITRLSKNRVSKHGHFPK